jgi:hypothetical protein
MARPIDWAVLMANKYGEAESTMSFIAGPARYKFDQKTTMTMFCTMKSEATNTRPPVKYDLIRRIF